MFRLSVTHVGRMNTQVRLLNSLVRLAGKVNGELVGSLRNMRRMIRELYAVFTVYLIQHTKLKHLKCLTFCLFPILARIAECSRQNRRMLGNYSPCQNRRMFRKKISVINQVCRFASTMKKKCSRNLTVAHHRHPPELALT